MFAPARIEEWKDLKFGMFIHWGLYALLGRGEWVMYNEAIPVEEYRTLKDRFTAEKFDAAAWAQTAKAAGMKYMVFTTRHHDGFSLWDSAGSIDNFTSMNSAAKKDFVREYVEACRAAGLKVGFYYSPLDWRCPGFFFPQMYKKSAMELRQQTHDQIRELMTDYGKIDILWFDGGEDGWLAWGRNFNKVDVPRVPRETPLYPGFWGGEELNEMIRTLQPGIVVNNRCGQPIYGDFKTPEETIGNFDTDYPWESCMTINGIWGWVPDKKPHSLRWVIRSLVQAVTGDGNLLLNVGPKADGSIEPLQVERLKETGAWLEKYGEAIYGTRGGPFRNSAKGGMTWKDNTLYVHVWEWDENEITLPKLGGEIVSVQGLTTDKVNYSINDGFLTFSVSPEDRNAPDTILKIELDGPIAPWAKQSGAWHV